MGEMPRASRDRGHKAGAKKTELEPVTVTDKEVNRLPVFSTIMKAA